MKTNRRDFLKVASAALAAPLASRSAFAAEWPKDRLIRAMVPFNPGASIDIIGRIISEGLSQRTGQTVIVENRGGAGGTIGAGQVAKAEPDGYTLLINSSNHTIAPALYKNLSFDPANDFAGVALFGSVPNVLMVAPDKGYKTVHDLVNKAKAQELTFSSSGVGAASHWAAERFRISAGFKAIHVPFKGGLESVTEVMTGRVDFCCVGISAAMGFIKEGKLQPLCVTSLKRSPSLPDLITSTEAGYKNSHYNFWNGMLVPAKTPRPLVERIHTEVMAVLNMPEVKKKLGVQGVEATPVSPAEYDKQIRQEIAENLEIAKAAGLQAN
jgi:tripartite-type tricarboxylate transporter receptor subunit TctC